MAINVNALQDHLTYGFLTPFVGAGVSATRDRSFVEDLLSVADDGQKTRDALRAAPGAISSYRFARLLSVLASPPLLRTIGETNRLPVDLAQDLYDAWKCVDEAEPEDCLVQFQERLHTLLAVLHELVGSRFTGGQGLVPWYRLKLTDTEVSKVAPVIASVLEAATDLNDTWCTFLPGLGDRLRADSILNGLRCLFPALVSEQKAQDLKLGRLRQTSQRTVAGNLEAHYASRWTMPGTLETAELEWLTALLWHLLRFDDSQLPSSRELGFRLSLKRTVSPPMMGNLSEMAEHINGEQRGTSPLILEVIQRGLGYCAETSRNAVSVHYLQLAASLRFMTLKAAKEAQVCEQVAPTMAGANPGTARRNAATRYAMMKGSEYDPPIVFTTNYDNCIESALDCCPDLERYHVLHPVREIKGECTRDTWVCITRSLGSAGATIHELLPPELGPGGGLTRDMGASGDTDRPFSDIVGWIRDGIEDREGPAARNRVGPIVIKLHGAPLHDVSEVRGVDKAAALEHLLLITESDYLQAMVEQRTRSMPLKAAKQVATSPFWFVGYSLADWNIRFQLYHQLEGPRLEGVTLEQTSASDDGHGPARNWDRPVPHPLRLALVESPDPYKQAIFQRLKVDAMEGDLDEFSATLEELLKNACRSEDIPEWSV